MKATRAGKHSGKNNAATAGLQYARLLLQFVQPIMPATPDMEELEEKLNIGLTAWNLAVIQQNDADFYKEYSNNFLTQVQQGKKLRQQIGKLIESKSKQYAGYNVILTNCEITAGKRGEAMVNVQSKTYAQFVQELLTAGTNEYEGEEESDSGHLNRTAITVIPKLPFFNWLKKVVFAGIQRPSLIENNTLYLIDALKDKKGIEQWLKKNFDQVFSSKLSEWTGEEDDWPEKRTYKMFLEWFDVKICSMIYDLGTSPLVKE